MKYIMVMFLKNKAVVAEYSTRTCAKEDGDYLIKSGQITKYMLFKSESKNDYRLLKKKYCEDK